MSATQIGLFSYESSSKQQSRRDLSKLLLDRIKEPWKATVLYLPGPTVCGRDFQRNSLVNEAGFDWHNLFGVDLGANVQSIRDLGGYCIRGKLDEVIRNWPDGRKIDVILADFCCGFDKTAMDAADAIGAYVARNFPQPEGGYSGDTNLRGPLIYINLQRGRDACTNEVRAKVEQLTKGGCVKHRAALFANYIMFSWIASQPWIPKNEFSLCTRQMVGIMDPATYEYKNSEKSVVMDSAMFYWPIMIKSPLGERDEELRRRIIATIATANRRKNARRKEAA